MHGGFRQLPNLRGPRDPVVGEDSARPDVHVVAQPDASVDRYVVLHLHTVADDDAGVDIDVLPECAAGADRAAFPDVGVVPDLGARPDVRPSLDYGRSMNVTQAGPCAVLRMKYSWMGE